MGLTEEELELKMRHLTYQLYKPLYVFNMARGDIRAGAQARRRNASKEILEVLRENGFELKEYYGIPSA